MTQMKRSSLALVIVGIIFGALWFWNREPAHVQAAIAEARNAAKRHDVMTVEAITEDGRSLVDRRISIMDARVTAVANARTFWVVGSEGDPLLVVVYPPLRDAAWASGQRVSLTGTVRDDAGADALDAKQRAELSKTDVYLLASEVQRLQ